MLMAEIIQESFARWGPYYAGRSIPRVRRHYNRATAGAPLVMEEAGRMIAQHPNTIDRATACQALVPMVWSGFPAKCLALAEDNGFCQDHPDGVDYEYRGREPSSIHRDVSEAGAAAMARAVSRR